MDWAERTYPDLFPGHQSNLQKDALQFRYYPQSGNYLGVSGDAVLVLGPMSNNQIVTVGTVGQFAAQIQASQASLQVESDAQAARFLLQAQFSASDAEIAAVRQKGYAAWLDEQLAIPSSQSAWDCLEAKGYTAIDSNTFFFQSYPGDYVLWYQLMAAPDPVRRRFALALSEFFVVSLAGISGSLNWPSFAIAHYWDILCNNAFGNFRQLLEEVTLSPAMGAWLNTMGSQKENPATGRLPDENYAREVMQLFTIGLNMLNPDGSPQRDSNGAPLETYTQSDVSNLARVFTGYQLDERDGFSNSPVAPYQRFRNVGYARRPMVLNASRHSLLEKQFLGVTIPANTDGATSLKIALDTLFKHPNVGPFFGRQMIQRLVTSNPSPAYVARVASVFNNNGAGVRGDLQALLRAILLDEEARSAAGLTSATFGKLREPMLRYAQWARTFGVRSAAGTWKVPSTTNSPQTTLAQSPLQAPSVFNFFRPGYVPPSTQMAASRATAPEFQLVNESTVASYINFIRGIVYQGLYVRAPELPNNPGTTTPTDGYDIAPDYSKEFALVADTVALVQRLNLLLSAGQISSETEAFIIAALRTDKMRSDSPDNTKRIHVARAIVFVMCCAEYLVQK